VCSYKLWICEFSIDEDTTLTWYALCAVNTSVNAIPHPVYLDVTLDYTLVILLFSSADGLQPPELIVGWMDG